MVIILCLEIFNNNTEAILAISALVQAAFTVILASITVYYVSLTHKLVKIEITRSEEEELAKELSKAINRR